MQIYSPSISIYHTHTHIYIYIRLWGGFGPVVFQWFSGGLSGKLFEVARQHCLFLQGERVSMRKRSAQVLRAEKKSAYVRLPRDIGRGAWEIQIPLRVTHLHAQLWIAGSWPEATAAPQSLRSKCCWSEMLWEGCGYRCWAGGHTVHGDCCRHDARSQANAHCAALTRSSAKPMSLPLSRLAVARSLSEYEEPWAARPNSGNLMLL